VACAMDSTEPSGRKIALVCNDDFTVWHFRRGLIEELLRLGHDVTVMAPDGDFVERLESLGIRFLPVPFGRFVHPVRDLLLIRELIRIHRREQFDLVHNLSSKAVSYGGIAARIAKVPRVIGLISGLGAPFCGAPGLKWKFLRWSAVRLYSVGLGFTHRAWFQNQDDVDLLTEEGALDPANAVVIRGSGVDVDSFSQGAVDEAELARLRDTLGIEGRHSVVLMVVARLAWHKGIKEFIDAARAFETTHPDVRFLIVGPYDPGAPFAVPTGFFEEELLPGNFHRMEFVDGIREVIALADVVTLPSFYREGVPRFLLESLSMGCPIVTTDNVGCRETVIEGENGYLVPTKDSEALIRALEKMLDDPDLIASFGRRSRMLAEEEFDERVVVNRVIDEVYFSDQS
jgi:N,N'-diacetylbacillosaminyl-diphospho-undecaprenol alpha-1,3-N-acetylgalactosaminyltransferase